MSWEQVKTNIEYKQRETKNLAKQIEADKSIVMTNPEMAKYLLSLIQFEDNDIVLEPCRGDGAFYNNFPDNVQKRYCEIDEDLDFLEYQHQVDYCISNPPFVPRKLFWEFNKKAMEITKKKIYWLINMSSLNVFTPKRLEEMRSFGWYINSFHIVADKRWFGRYIFIEIGREDKGIMNWLQKVF